MEKWCNQIRELAEDTTRNKELDKRFELLEDDRVRNAELAMKLEKCMFKVNKCNSMCASLLSGGNEHEDVWDEEETYDEQEEANRKILKLAEKKHNQEEL